MFQPPRSQPHSTAYLRLLAALLLATTAGCANTGEYVWFQQLQPDTAQASSEYIIGVGDVINVRVLGHDDLTLKQRVRSDGRIAMLLLGDVDAKGKRPSALKAELEGRLKDFIVAPSLAVNIDEAQPIVVLFFGEVSRPGVVSLDQDRRLVHALALAGGLTDFASRSSIFVGRAVPTPMRIRFRYEAIVRNIGKAGDFQLQRGDIVEVQ
jgi:polysaccharide export outer membrane protein